MTKQVTIIKSDLPNDFLDIGFAADEFANIRSYKIQKRIDQLAQDTGIEIKDPLLAIVEGGNQYRIRYKNKLEVGIMPKGITCVTEFIRKFTENNKNPTIVEYSSNFMLDRAYSRLPSKEFEIVDLR